MDEDQLQALNFVGRINVTRNILRRSLSELPVMPRDVIFLLWGHRRRGGTWLGRTVGTCVGRHIDDGG